MINTEIHTNLLLASIAFILKLANSGLTLILVFPLRDRRVTMLQKVKGNGVNRNISNQLRKTVHQTY